MTSKRRASSKLTRKRIRNAALVLIDKEGVEKFNMRRLARELDVDPMAVYYHYKNKAELMGDVINAMFADFEMPDETGDWRKDVSNFFQQLREMARKHPGAFQFYEEYENWTQGEHRLTERLYGILLSAGFPEEHAVWVKRMLWTYAEVFAFDEVAGWHEEADKEEFLDSLPDGEHPNLTALAERIVRFKPDEEFKFGLNTLMDGLESKRV